MQKMQKRTLSLFIAVMMVMASIAFPTQIGGVESYGAEQQVKSVTIEGDLIIGQTVVAKPEFSDPSNVDGVKYEWQYYFEDDYFDEDMGDYDESEWREIPDAKESTYKIAEKVSEDSLKGKRLKVIVTGKDNKKVEKATTEKIKEPAKSQNVIDLEKVADKLGNVSSPQYGRDNNIIEYIKGRYFADEKLSSDDELRNAYQGVEINVSNGSETSNVKSDGGLIYFFDSELNRAGKDKYLQQKISLEFSKGGEKIVREHKVNIFWDLEKLKAALKQNVLDSITEDILKGTNESKDSIVNEYELPSKLSAITYASIEWESLNPDILSITKNSDGKFFKVVPVAAATDQNVRIKAKIADYNFTNDTNGNYEKNAVRTVEKEFSLTVKKWGQDPQIEMQKALNEAFVKENIKYFDDNSVADINAVERKLTLRFVKNGLKNTAYADQSVYPLTFKSDKPALIKPMAYVAEVINPELGKDREVHLTAIL